MPLDNKSPDTPPAPRKGNNFSNQFAMAMELPFILVGAVLLGGLLGYFLDRWLHTKPALMLVFGALGFFGGVRDILRRMPAGGSNDGSGDGSSGS
ncbi:MAG: AtpZ/AtpI family protein [Acidobacteriota bacterium]|nr:AtpZ/AtpI family protein [Acidobacteriota bacterium]